MSECGALEKKNQQVEPGLVIAQRTTDKADLGMKPKSCQPQKLQPCHRLCQRGWSAWKEAKRRFQSIY